jgi:hypothetical protein
MARRTFALPAEFCAPGDVCGGGCLSPMHEASESSEAEAAAAEGDESDDPMTPDTEHVLWELLVGDAPPDGENP